MAECSILDSQSLVLKPEVGHLTFTRKLSLSLKLLRLTFNVDSIERKASLLADTSSDYSERTTRVGGRAKGKELEITEAGCLDKQAGSCAYRLSRRATNKKREGKNVKH